MSLSVRVLCFPRKTPLQKNKFSFASGNQMEIPCGVGIRAYVPSFSSGIPSAVDRCRPWACSLSFSKFVWTSFLLDSSGLVSLVSSIPSYSCILSASCSTEFPELLGGEGEFDWNIQFKAECSKVSYSLHVSLWSLYLCPSAAQRSLFYSGWTRSWSVSSLMAMHL